MIIDNELLNKVTAEAGASPRLRMNFNLHDSLDAKVQRLINVLLPGTVLPIHRHRHTAETYVLLRGKMFVVFTMIWARKSSVISSTRLSATMACRFPKDSGMASR